MIIHGRMFRFYHGQIAPMTSLAPPAPGGLSELRLTPFALHLGRVAGCPVVRITTDYCDNGTFSWNRGSDVEAFGRLAHLVLQLISFSKCCWNKKCTVESKIY